MKCNVVGKIIYPEYSQEILERVKEKSGFNGLYKLLSVIFIFVVILFLASLK